MIELYALSGQRAAALRQYGQCTRIFAQELGLEPEAEARALYEAVRAGKLVPREAGAHRSLTVVAPLSEPAAPERRHNLPSQTGPFVGRGKDLTAIRPLLEEQPGRRLVTLVGPGGIGKTRLALQVAFASQDAFSDGVHFIPLAALESHDHIAPALAERLNFRAFAEGEPAGQLLDYLRDKRVLLVMDNFEHLLDGAGIVSDILRTAPGVKILATSIERLNLHDEVVYTLGGMAYPDFVSPIPAADDDFLKYEAVQLLVQRARLVRPDLELQPRDLGFAARICQLVAGNPLALVLAAGWLELFSFERIAGEISQTLDFLEAGSRDLPARQRSLRAVFDYTWGRLPETDRFTFIQLAVFKGGFTRQAARRVAGADLRSLRSLLNKSLIFTDGEDRYGIHTLLRQYAEEKISVSGELDRTRELHSSYFLGLLHQLEDGLKGHRQLEAIAAIESDLENHRASWMWALERENYAALQRALECLYIFFFIQDREWEGAHLFLATLERLDPSAGEAAQSLYRQVLTRCAPLAVNLPEFPPDLIHDLRTSLAAARKCNDRLEIAQNLLSLGHLTYTGLRDVPGALVYYQDALQAFQHLGERFYAMWASLAIGVCQLHLARQDESRKTLEQVLDAARHSGNRVVMSQALSNLAALSFFSGDYPAAANYGREGLALSLQLGRRGGIAYTKSLLGLVHLLGGELDASASLAEEALRIATDLHYATILSYARPVLGMHACLAGDYSLGERLGQEGLAAALTNLGFILANWELSTVYCGLERYSLAWQHIQESLRLAAQADSVAVMTWSLPVAAILTANRGHKNRASELMALAQLHPIGPRGWLAEWPLYTHLQDDLKSDLGGEAFAAAWERGRSLDLVATLETLVHSFADLK